MAPFVFLPVLLAMLFASASAQLTTCPVDPDSAVLDFSGVPTACDASGGVNQAFCDSCLCGLVDVYMPAFEAAGILDQIGAGGEVPVDEASNLISLCSTTFLAPLLASGVELTGLMNLPDCDFESTATPACVEEKFRARIPEAVPVVVDSPPAVAMAPPDAVVDEETIIPDAGLDNDVIGAVDAPDAGAPPDYEEYPPAADTPVMDTPVMDTPVMDTPDMGTSPIDTPGMDTPDMDTPDMDTPATMDATPPPPDVRSSEGPSTVGDGRIDPSSPPTNAAGRATPVMILLQLSSALVSAFLLSNILQH